MARTYFSEISCGVHQLAGLQESTDAILAVVAERRPHYVEDNRLRPVVSPCGCAFIIFSDADAFRNGQRLAAAIQELKLGELSESAAMNPNSGNHIRVWVWKVDWDALRDYLNRRKV